MGERNFLKRVVIGTKEDTRKLMIKITGRQKIFKRGKEGHPSSHCTEGNKKNFVKKST